MPDDIAPVAKSVASLLDSVVQSLGENKKYVRAKKILEHAISQLPAGKSTQQLQESLPMLRSQLKRLLKKADKKSTWASHSGFISAVSAVHEDSDVARMLVQSRLPANRQLLHTITSGDSVHESIRTCSRLCAASGAQDITIVVQHACHLADTVLKPAAQSLLRSSPGSGGHLRVNRHATDTSANISDLADAISELAAIARLRAAAQSKEPTELLHNAGHASLHCCLQGRLLFTLAAAHVCDSLLHADHTEWNSETFLHIHAMVVTRIHRFCVSVDTVDVEGFLLGHPVMEIDSLQAAPWAAVPMCAWLAVRVAARPPTRSHALPLQAVLLQRAELQLHSIAGDTAECAQEIALMRDKLCTSDAVAWIKNLSAGASLPSYLRTHAPSESTLAALLLEHTDWAEITALNRMYLASLQPDVPGGEQHAADQSLFVLDGAADAAEQWNEEMSDQDDSSVDGDE